MSENIPEWTKQIVEGITGSLGKDATPPILDYDSRKDLYRITWIPFGFNAPQIIEISEGFHSPYELRRGERVFQGRRKPDFILRTIRT